MPDSTAGRTPTGTLRGTILRRFVRERLLELELESGHDREAASTAAEARRESPGGPTSFVYVAACAHVLDRHGVEQSPREGFSTWFADDWGWRLVKIGQSVSVDVDGAREVAAPKGLTNDDGRTGSSVLAL